MRIKLKEGKQRELINLAKRNLTWKELSEKINLSQDYIRNELKNEERLLSEETYKKLCQLTNFYYNNFIEEKLDDNWGRSKGGSTFKGKKKWGVKDLTEPKEDKKLAELSGIILGDGHIESYIKGKRIRCYAMQVSGDLSNDFEYLSKYVTELIKEVFKEKPKLKKVPKENGVYIRIYGKNIVLFLEKKGLKAGNKKKNNQGIPNWIKDDDIYLIECLRGLIDTDGSVHYISRGNKNIRISFTSYIPKLIYDVRESLLRLGVHPSKIIKNNQIFLSRKEDISLYMKLIGFNNQKHLKRFESLENKAPVV